MHYGYNVWKNETATLMDVYRQPLLCLSGMPGYLRSISQNILYKHIFNYKYIYFCSLINFAKPFLMNVELSEIFDLF